ncbi:hypothetical protein QZH41_002733, partial [Actinostola sp. cb2023]
MGSPLGPVLANIFMVELERTVVPILSPKITGWKRYVDDTYTYVKNGTMAYVLNELNSFDEKIQFTCEPATNNTITFLDVNITRQVRNISAQKENKYRSLYSLDGTSTEYVEKWYTKRSLSKAIFKSIKITDSVEKTFVNIYTPIIRSFEQCSE